MLLSTEINQALGQIEQGRVAVDGAELLYQSFGRGPTIMIANGIGVRYPGLVRQLQALRREHQVVCWDYRGIGQSVMPPDGDVSMPRHAADALAVLDRLGIERALFIGWSMGSQVGLEVARRQPGRLSGFVALLGSSGLPIRTAFPGALAWGAEGAFAALQHAPLVLQRVFDLSVAMPRLSFAVLKRLMFIGPGADRDVFAHNIRCVAGVDKQVYARTMLAMAGHDASDVLATLRCPALIIAAERDYLTPPRVARQMAEAIPDAVYRELPRATHFGLIEQPDQVNDWLLEFSHQVYSTSSASSA